MEKQLINSRTEREYEIEHQIIGGIMDNPNQISIVINQIQPAMFSFEQCRNVYETMIDLFDKNIQIEFGTVMHELRDRKIDVDQGWLLRLWEWGNWYSDFNYYIKRFLRYYTIRKLIELSCEIAQKADQIFQENELVDFIDKLAETIVSLRTGGDIKIYEAGELINEATEKTVAAEKGEYAGIETGYSDIDKVVPGFIAGDLIIIAGLTGIGKSAFALNLVENMAVQNKLPILYLSLEMDSIPLIRRLVCSRSDILDMYSLKKGVMDDRKWTEWSYKSLAVANSGFKVAKKVNMNINDIFAITRLAILKHKIRLVVVDYLQLLSGGKKQFSNETAEVAYISRSLKQLAMDMEIPVIAISQLRKIPEKKIPTLNDLKQSGSIAQDADFVFFIHRDKEEDSEIYGNETKLIIAKQRDGEQCVINLIFRPKKMRFELRAKGN